MRCTGARAAEFVRYNHCRRARPVNAGVRQHYVDLKIEGKVVGFTLVVALLCVAVLAAFLNASVDPPAADNSTEGFANRAVVEASRSRPRFVCLSRGCGSSGEPGGFAWVSELYLTNEGSLLTTGRLAAGVWLCSGSMDPR
jgi:hypothetical protein